MRQRGPKHVSDFGPALTRIKVSVEAFGAKVDEADLMTFYTRRVDSAGAKGGVEAFGNRMGVDE